MAPACTVRLSAAIFRIWFIFIRMRVPLSATPQAAVEWFEPTARTGEGYVAGSLITRTMSSTEFASTTTAGWETMLPNQLVTVFVAIWLPFGVGNSQTDFKCGKAREAEAESSAILHRQRMEMHRFSQEVYPKETHFGLLGNPLWLIGLSFPTPIPRWNVTTKQPQSGMEPGSTR